MTDRRRLVPWRDTAKPHRDIVEGRFDLSLFAVSIYQVYRGIAPLDYQDPDRFFAKTYMTKALRNLIKSVLWRLSGAQNGDPITDLMTSFGGGKTHALLCLYHLASAVNLPRRRPEVEKILMEINVQAIPKAQVAVLSGEDFDPGQGETGQTGIPTRNTIWGELAWQLGGQDGYEIVRSNDERRSAPTANVISKVLKLNQVNLILIDEALRFISRSRAIAVHETSLGAQTLEFFRALTEAVSRTPSAALVATLQASVLEMAQEDEQDYRRLLEIFKRVGKPISLAEGDEIYEIVRRRLFDDPGDQKVIRETSNAYYDYYREHRDTFPASTSAPSYLQKILRAYPFHPELLDILNERWASIPNFQRTRSILRMLAMLVSALYKSDPRPLIQVSSAPLGERDFRTEMLQQLHAESQFDSVIESDIAGTGARAQKIDQGGNITYQREHLAECAATAVFFYSFGGSSTLPSASVPYIRLSVLRPGLEPAFISETLQLLRKPVSGLFYLETEGDICRFTVTPNLNMLAAEREAAIDPEEVEKHLLDTIPKQFGARFRIISFPADPRDVPDQPNLALIIMMPNQTIGKSNSADTLQRVREIIRGGTTFRTNRNCLIFSVAEEGHRMREAARSLLALRDIDRLYGKSRKLSDPQRSQLDAMLRDSDKGLAQSIWRAYRFILTPGSEETLEEFDLGLQVQQGDRKISDNTWDTLVVRERLAPRLGPTRLLSREFLIWTEGREQVPTKELRDAFRSFTYLPMIPDLDVLRKTIVQGVTEGVFGYARGVYGGKLISVAIGSRLESDAIEFSDDSLLLRAEVAYKYVGEPTRPELLTAEGAHVVLEGEQGRRSQASDYDSVTVSGDLDWKKWSEFYDAVIKPLVNAGAIVKIRLTVNGESELGISQNTIELAIKESLSQYGIRAIVEPKKRA